MTLSEAPPLDKTGRLTSADQNPWYLLATLHGEARGYRSGTHFDENQKLRRQNRVAWNRLVVTWFKYMDTELLKADVDYIDGEYEPYSAVELLDHRQLFVARGGDLKFIDSLESSGWQEVLIDFSNTYFPLIVDYYRFLFPRRVTFEGAEFGDNVDFAKATFSDYGNFERCSFRGSASFNCSCFDEWADFQDSNFSRYANFRYSKFVDGANFNGFSIAGPIDFADTDFGGSTNFQSAHFADRAVFYGANFAHAAFQKAAFADRADFDRVTFGGSADFQEARFASRGQGQSLESYRHRDDDEKFQKHGREWHGASFRGATFTGKVDFENVVFSASSRFSEATFKAEPPFFMGASLHEGTEWRRINWPLPNSRKNAGAFIDAYACLKLEMDRLKRHEDELDFFALELRSRRVAHGWWRGFPIALYGWSCDFGRSYFRPLWLMAAAWIGFLAAYCLWPGRFGLADALGLSLASMLGVFGFRRELVSPSTLEELPSFLKIISGMQTILGATLLFLFVLSLRNRFRMK
jgi:uncharacterized protein YjbI with pentapeptide repeats